MPSPLFPTATNRMHAGETSVFPLALAKPILLAAPLLLLIGGCASQPDNFAASDKDGDGKLSADEVRQALQTAIYANGDPDGDGKISYAEYQTVDPHFPKARFDARDLDDDGYVTPDELERFAARNRSFDDLINAFDANDDGGIDRAEAEVFNEHLMKSEGENVLQKLYHLNSSLPGSGK